MLFNSFSFLLVFLPITLLGFALLGRRSTTLAAAWLAAASLLFYGWWDYRYIPLLIGSIVANFQLSRWIDGASSPTRKKQWLRAAITANLVLLAYYKYANFFLEAASSLFGAAFQPLAIVLPIGISFFTFTQIAFLVDTYQGKVKEYRFIHYVLFVTYFPHLIAGPVLHHKEMMPQFGDPETYRLSSRSLAVGWTIFCIGLAKKVLLADNLAPFAADLFDHQTAPSAIVGWGGVFAYAFQLYFDFSGYSDMAIGLSRMFGVRLPLNFNSPYKSRNITLFWRRWHMTLSRFLRDYLYIPLGGNKRGPVRRYVNLMITMVLGGLWHGAGWNFPIWGGLHGSYLIINHAWAALSKRIGFEGESRLWQILSTFVTFIAVCFAWIFFRAENLPAAKTIITGITGGFGFGLPDAIVVRAPRLAVLLKEAGVTFYTGGSVRFLQLWSWIFGGAFVVFFLPNTQQILARFEPALDFDPSADCAPKSRILWSPSSAWAFSMAVLTVAGLLSLCHPSEFLYFQF